jgi:phosphatidate cytidylyltransferase
VRTRVIGAVFVVVAGLVPSLAGGPLFALLMIVLGVASYHEFLDMSAHLGPKIDGAASLSGYVVVVAFALIGLAGSGSTALYLVTASSLALPLLVYLPRVDVPGSAASWSLSSSGSLYLGLPIYAAIVLRGLSGQNHSTSLFELARASPFPWDIAPRGLAWAMLTILVIWIGDTTAYFAGRSFGRAKLAPRISPGKTIVGGVAGLVSSALVGGATFTAFGLGVWWVGLIVGAVVGIMGQVGDLCESFLKRQAGIKDSGQLIPGHGGVLDRIDALLFAFPTSLIIAAGLERFGMP